MGGEGFAGRFHSVGRDGTGSGWGKLLLSSVGVRNGGPETPPWGFHWALIGSGRRAGSCLWWLRLQGYVPTKREKLAVWSGWLEVRGEGLLLGGEVGGRGDFLGEVLLGRLGLEGFLVGKSAQGQWRRPGLVAAGRAWEVPTRFAWVRRAVLLPVVGHRDSKAMSLLST